MTKKVFLKKLRKKLSKLPRHEANERVSFYSEMIDDKIDDGMSEADAIVSIGAVDIIASDILIECGTSTKTRGRRKGLNILLLILGFPIWFSLFVAVFAVVISIFAALWSIVVSFWAVMVSLGASAIALIPLSFIWLFTGNFLTAIVGLGAAVACVGLTLLFYLVSIYVTKLCGRLTKLFARAIINIFR